MRTSNKYIGVRGNTMLVILIVLAILSAAVGGALSLTGSLSRNVNRTNRYRDALAVGDGALDYLFSHWYTKSRARANNQLKAEEFADIPLPTADQFPTVPDFSVTRDADDSFALANLRIQGLDQRWQPIADSAVVPASHGMNPGARSYFYLASADVTLANINGKPMHVKARRIFEKEIGSPWMYAIFYTDRLEIHPGPEFHVTGWVHTNENLYTAHKSLWLESKVTYVGEWEHQYAPMDGAPGHDRSKATSPNTNPELPPRKEETQAPMGLDTPDFNLNDSNKNNDGYRELIERPDSGSPMDPAIEDQRYYNQADVKVLVDGNDATGKPIVKILNHDGKVLSPSDTGTDLAIYNTFKNAVTVGDKIQDNREAAEVRLITVDMSKVTASMQPPAGPLFGKVNGVIYVSDGTATGSARRGVRLKNGGTMPQGGLTIVSDNPVYIQGDYNTGSNGTLQPDSNLSNGDPNKNTVPGYQKQSSAVIGDAVMVLSNAWSDANSYKAVDQRKATPTTVNAAIVSGIVPTGEYGNNYSGGAENFPRFMEKWGSGTTFTYHGSMVELYKSLQNKGAWGKGNVYDPPRRQWFFDRQFYTDPPPGTLSLVRFKKSRWYQE